MVRVMLKWKYPFQPPVDGLQGGWEKEMGKLDATMKHNQREKRRSDEVPQRPTAKERVKVLHLSLWGLSIPRCCSEELNLFLYLNRLRILNPKKLKLFRKRRKLG